ncbi:class I SAM-dependent methyltransferase [Pseudonocardia sp. CA-107938]|uniref:class I SAM-dependent methyltransferase n=1 Tax=Pseudonocardia sp. CA-107938 TaxID=3240021 RepID=UPI003D90618D
MHELAEMFEEPYWEARYRSRTSVWSGRPNAHLVAEVAGLAPGTAIDVGAGEGADAVWLARAGWQVTALEFSRTALDRGAAQGVPGIEWVQGDARTFTPPPPGYDLVTSSFVHLPAGQFEQYFARLVAMVAPGGTLLVGAHHPDDLANGVPRPPHPDLFRTAEQLAALLPAGWVVDTAAAPTGEQRHPETGEPMTITFAVLRARRPE